jgi:SAM-dependent methyltransferase
MKHRVIRSRNEYIANVVRGKTVLDLGCVNHQASQADAPHWLHRVLVNNAASVTGLDYEEAEIIILQNQGYSVVAADACNFDLTDSHGIRRQFDVIVAGEILEHLLDAQGLLQSALKHLRKDGSLIISVPNALCITYFISNLFRGRELDNPDHTCLYSETTLTHLLKRCGYCVEAVMYFRELDGEEGGIGLLVRNLIQKITCIFRPSLCHHLLVKAKVYDS